MQRSQSSGAALRQIAVIGAGLAGITAARTLAQAGLRVQLFDKQPVVGGRMARHDTVFGNFDHGAQYFTVRDARFAQALATQPALARRWSARAVPMLDSRGSLQPTTEGHETLGALGALEPHWVGVPTMRALPEGWAAPLAPSLHLGCHVRQLRRQGSSWQLLWDDIQGSKRLAGFDAVVLAIPAPHAIALLQESEQAAQIQKALQGVVMDPCWTLMVAFAHAAQPTFQALGPQWNAARSTHPRISWLAREPSKPGRGGVERWTVHASASWSREHLQDEPARVQAKLLRAFAELTGIRAEPELVESQRWLYASTRQSLGRSHVWDARLGLGLCGDWCLGHRIEDAFVSGLELALRVVDADA